MEISVEHAPRIGNQALDRLVEEHRQYSRKLESLLSHRYLSETEQIEAVRLKKMKLRLKDEMERWVQPLRFDRKMA